LGTRRLGREPVSVFGGGVMDFLSLAQPAAVDISPFYLCPDFTHDLVPGLPFFFRPSLLWMSSSITKRTITPTIAYSSFSSQYSRRSISSIPLLKGISHLVALGPVYFISSILFFAGLVIAAITRNERYHQSYVIFFLAQTNLIGFNLFRTLI
jgi:hypothetical protein